MSERKLERRPILDPAVADLISDMDQKQADSMLPRRQREKKARERAKIEARGVDFFYGATQALHDVGYVQTDTNPDYVVVGEVNNYNFELITKAVRLITDGAMFIATNPDSTGPLESGIVPATGALAALIEKATGKAPFFVGKPNPLMMRSALRYLGVHSEDTIMVGDRMDTDIVAGVMSGLDTILVLSGVSTLADVELFPYRPTYILKSVEEIEIECG